MELQLSMTWIPKQEEKYSGIASLKALLSFLYSDLPKLGTTVGHLSFSVLKLQRSNSSCLLTLLPSKQEEYWFVTQG